MRHRVRDECPGQAPGNIVFLPGNKYFDDLYSGKFPTCVGERNLFTRKAIAIWGDLLTKKQKITVFTDGGNAWKDGSQKCFEQEGFESQVIFPSKCHQNLSTQDNGVLGTAKSKWRHAAAHGQIDYIDEPQSTLFLMKHVDGFNKGQIMDCWTRNFMLGHKDMYEVTLEQVKNEFGKESTNWKTHHDECRGFYRDFLASLEPGALGRPIKQQKVKRYTGHNGPKFKNWDML